MATKNAPDTSPPRGEPPRGDQARDGRTGNKPVHEVRLGRIRAAVWLNEAENGPRYNVPITRLYNDRKDKWKDSARFGREDLPLVARVADLAMAWMDENPAGPEK